MKILLYTHSDYSWVWKYWHQQSDRFLKDYQKICMINSNSDFRKDYLTIKYDDQKTYKNRILSCLDKIDNEEIVLFCHEDMFLYDKPDTNLLHHYINFIKDGKCELIKFKGVHIIDGSSIKEGLHYPNYFLMMYSRFISKKIIMYDKKNKNKH